MTMSNIVAMICLVLTQSTAGYIAFFVLLVYIAYQRRSKLMASFLLLLLLPIALYVYQLPFMKDKIDVNIEMYETGTYHETGRGRISSAVHSIVFFRNNWLIGKGLTYDSAQTISREEFSGFSILHLGGQLGIVGLLLYSWGLYAVFKWIQIKHAVRNSGLIATMLILLAVVLAFTSQQVSYYRPLMLTMVFYGLSLRFPLKRIHS